MLLKGCVRVSWVCLLFFSTASCYPVNQAAFNHPQARSWFSGGTNSPSDGLSQPGSAVGQNPPPAVFYLPGVPSKGVGQVQPPPSPGKTPEVQSGSTSNEGSPGVPQPADSASVYVGYNYGSHYAAAPDGGQPEPDAAENTDSAEPASPEVQQPQDEGGAGVVDVNSWFLSRPFPDFTVWDSSPVGAAEFVSETSPPLPSSYIIQSNSGYQRLREFLSHTKYTPDYYIPVDSEPPVLPPADPSSKATPDVKGTP
ncbi:uncharacterized protein LOC103382284 isoform X1 [Cynoglossus semilaevis]|uniref:uncharacterized protein LOC103382284 isoform X1 n=1 Tax=Cynoglossus semilaevis TaxID=244447 RepID=UPI0004974897|nr:uncharacterized protein LOC103382284 isoform X1 [Cynoglossus semilaevis]